MMDTLLPQPAADMDIIFLSLSRWDGPYSSTSFSLAKEFAKNHRVFFVDHPFTVKDFYAQYSKPNIRRRRKALFGRGQITRKVSGLPDKFTAVTPPLTLPINWLPAGLVYEKLSGFNDTLFFQAIRRIIRENGIMDFIFINSFDPFFGRFFPADIRPAIKVYLTVDDISQSEYVSKHGTRLENEAIAQADITLATSRELTKLKSAFTTRVFHLPNAADIALFRKAVDSLLPVPLELGQKAKPIIAYTGNIGVRIDYDLLRQIALAHPDKTLLMVGPLANDSYKQAGLDRLPNVVFTGAKDLAELPNYLQHVQVAIIPFECTTLTRSIYPLKINEYLAAGKPVVCTDFSEDIRTFGQVAYIAQDAEQFIKMIDQAIAEDNPDRQQARVQAAEQNTWAARVKTFWEIIENFNKSNTKTELLRKE